MYIYLITNLINGKQYVGQTTKSIQERWKRHCWSCTKNTNMPISIAIDKYGKENFKIETIVECKTEEELDNMEVYYVNNLNTWCPNGYNLRAGRWNGEVNKIIAERQKKLLLGRKASPELKKKLSLTHKGLKLSESTIKKLKERYKGKTVSELGPIAAALSNSKTYYFIDPNGNPITITNMGEFCRLHNLRIPNMSMVATNKRNHHRGWKLDMSKYDNMPRIKYNAKKKLSEVETTQIICLLINTNMNLVEIGRLYDIGYRRVKSIRSKIK